MVLLQPWVRRGIEEWKASQPAGGASVSKLVEAALVAYLGLKEPKEEARAE